MNRRRNLEGMRKFPSTIIFLLGFLLGTVLPNLIWKENNTKSAFSSLYLLTLFRQQKCEEKSILYAVWRQKGTYLLFTILSGFTIFGVPLAILEMLLLGIFTGGILTISILQFGIYGGIVGTAMLMPHYILYYPACFLLLNGVYLESHMIWKRKGALPEKMTEYGKCILLSFSLAIAGSVLEAFANPWILRLILRLVPIY